MKFLKILSVASCIFCSTSCVSAKLAGTIVAEIDNGHVGEAIIYFPVAVPLSVALDVIGSPLILNGVIAGDCPTAEMYKMGYNEARHKLHEKK